MSVGTSQDTPIQGNQTKDFWRYHSPKSWKRYQGLLDSSQDGRGLKDHCGTEPHGFMLNGSLTLKGWEFVNLAKVRGNLVKTKGRSSRGRPIKYQYCG